MSGCIHEVWCKNEESPEFMHSAFLYILGAYMCSIDEICRRYDPSGKRREMEYGSF